MTDLTSEAEASLMPVAAFFADLFRAAEVTGCAMPLPPATVVISESNIIIAATGAAAPTYRLRLLS